jgi:hypothetical protein
MKASAETALPAFGITGLARNERPLQIWFELAGDFAQ